MTEDTKTPQDAGEPSEQETIAAQKDRYLRLAAEFDNYRKRVQRDREEQRLRDRDALLGDWLEVVDNVERALAASPSNADALREGVEAILKQTRGLLERYEVQAIRPTGQPFDPQLHEAVGTIAVPTAGDGEVVHTERTGYTRPGRVLRPARVVVNRRG